MLANKSSVVVIHGTTIDIAYNCKTQRIEAKQGDTLLAYWELKNTNLKYYLKTAYKRTIISDWTLQPPVELKPYNVEVK